MDEEPLLPEDVTTPSPVGFLAEILDVYSPLALARNWFGKSFWFGALLALPVPLMVLGFPGSMSRTVLELRDPGLPEIVLMVLPLFSGLLFGGVGIVFEHLLRRVWTEYSRDYLTDLYDHRIFRVMLRKKLEEAKRYEQPLSVVLLDLDHFKRINDTYGHPTGDRTLKTVADLLLVSTRSSDIVCRYGGEEFGLILPQTSLDNAEIVVERIRRRIEEYEFEETFQLTVSGGVSAFPLDDPTADGLIQRADDRLYEAKESGRNRIVLSGSTDREREPTRTESPTPR